MSSPGCHGFSRLVAISGPLHYSVIMQPRLCLQLAAASWISGFSNSVMQSTLTLQMPRCGHRKMDHYCEVPALLRLSCVDTTANETELFFVSVLFLSTTCGTHSYIICFYCQVLRIQSAGGRRKAFETCGSHRIAVSLFHGTAIYKYLQPLPLASKDLGKMVSLLCEIFTPKLNTLIYTLMIARVFSNKK